MSKEQGKCPKCKSGKLDWGDRDIDGDTIAYDVMCLDCDWNGTEVYQQTFQGYYEAVTGEEA